MNDARKQCRNNAYMQASAVVHNRPTCFIAECQRKVANDLMLDHSKYEYDTLPLYLCASIFTRKSQNH